jgi:hypothetical protein
MRQDKAGESTRISGSSETRPRRSVEKTTKELH